MYGVSVLISLLHKPLSSLSSLFKSLGTVACLYANSATKHDGSWQVLYTSLNGSLSPSVSLSSYRLTLLTILDSVGSYACYEIDVATIENDSW